MPANEVVFVTAVPGMSRLVDDSLLPSILPGHGGACVGDSHTVLRWLNLLSRVSNAEAFVLSSGIGTVILEHSAVFSGPLVGQPGT